MLSSSDKQTRAVMQQQMMHELLGAADDRQMAAKQPSRLQLWLWHR
jgi:hypothetical protein